MCRRLIKRFSARSGYKQSERRGNMCRHHIKKNVKRSRGLPECAVCRGGINGRAVSVYNCLQIIKACINNKKVRQYGRIIDI